MDENDQVWGEFFGKVEENEEAQMNELVLLQLKPYCLELLDLLQNPKKHCPAISALLALLRNCPSSSLQPFLDYTMFPLLLLLDAAVDCRSIHKINCKEKFVKPNVTKDPYKVSDSVAEGVLKCLEELLRKCQFRSPDQMAVVLKKLTFWVMLSPSEASEEFFEGVIKCFRAFLLNLIPCGKRFCSCRSSGLPTLLEHDDFQSLLIRSSEHAFEPEECLLAFLQSHTSAAAVGHWLSILLKVADTEASRGHQGSAKLRIEAFMTLRVLVAKVGTAEALAFFLPGVVSQFAKVLHVSRTMISGAAGSAEAMNQAIRGLAEYIMIVLQDNANLSSLDMSDIVDVNSRENKSTYSFLEEMRSLPKKAQSQRGSEVKDSNSEMESTIHQKIESRERRKIDPGHDKGSFHVNRTKEWIESTSAHVDMLLSATFSHICIHPVKRVRKGLLAAIRGLLSKCSFTLKKSRLMFLECLCVLAIDDSDEVSAVAQEFLGELFSSSGKYHVACDVSEIFRRLIEKLPKVVLASEEALAISHAQKLFVVMYYSGPQLVVDYLLQYPVTAARVMDVFASCLSQNSVFAGSLDKLTLATQSSKGYLQSVAELKGGTHFTCDTPVISKTSQSKVSKLTGVQEEEIQDVMDNVLKNYDLPHMPPWFVHVGSPKLYEALAGILRLVGLSLMADIRSKGQLSVITDIPLGYLRNLVSEVRMKEYNKESWQSWYNRIGSGQLLRQASTAACILNEIIFGISDQFVDTLRRIFHKFKLEKEAEKFNSELSNAQSYKSNHHMLKEPIWKVSSGLSARSVLIDTVGGILHEYLSPEVWVLPVENNSSLVQPNDEAEDITLHFLRDTAMLHQVVIDGIGIFNVCLGKDFASSGFLHSSLYLLLENLICSNFQVKNAADAVLHILAATSGYPTVGHLIVSNADYVIDSICRQLRHLDLNAHVPNVLAAMLSYIGVAHKILPLLEEPMRSVSLELEILGRHQHPNLTIPFLKAVAEIAKVLKHEAYSLPTQAESNSTDVKSIISEMETKERKEENRSAISLDDTLRLEIEQWENILFKLNDSRRYRRIVGAIAGSCLSAATPLLTSLKQGACLVALDIVEDGMVSLAKVEEAYRQEKEIKEEIEQVIRSFSFYQLQDSLDTAEEETDENRLLPAMNKIWPVLVVCVQSNSAVVVRRCLSVITNLVQICGGDFFSRRFYSDGPQFWKLLSTSPFQKNLKSKGAPLQLPYRTASISSEPSLAEVTNQKVQIAVLNMIADLARNKRSASALEVVLKKVSGLVVGIACSGVVGLRDASTNALHGLAEIDPDLIWLLLADVYYSLKKDLPSPPSSNLPELSQILPPVMSSKGYLYVQYGGQSYGFEIDSCSVETVFRKLHGTNQMYS